MPNRRAFLGALALAPVPIALSSRLAWAAPSVITEVPIEAAPKALRSAAATDGPPTSQPRIALLPRRGTSTFSTLGVTWQPNGDEPVTVWYRTRRGGTWGSWAATDPRDTHVVGERRATDPVYVGGSDAVEVALTGSGAVIAPTLVLVAPSTASAPFAAAAASTEPSERAPRPSIVSRKGWGADESWRESGYKYDDTIRGAIVHHTAGVNSYSRSEAPSIVRGVYAYHTRTLGWSDIGYNFLIDKYGTIYEGRAGGVDRAVHGAHATDWNTDTVGISFMGNFETATPPAVMIEAAAKLLAWKLEAFYVDPQAWVTLAGKRIRTISGHRDVMSTACPGRNMYSRMGSFRSAVDSRVAGSSAIQKRWAALGGVTGAAGIVVEPERAIAGGRVTRCRNYDLYHSSATGVHWVKGSIRGLYKSLGGPAGQLKFPVGDEEVWPFSWARTNRFQGGGIVWGGDTGARLMIHGFWTAYRTDSGLRSRLKLPTTAQSNHPVLGMAWQRFQSGQLFWVDGRRAVAIINGLDTFHRGLSAQVQRGLGEPIAAEERTASGVVLQRFRTGVTYWNGKGFAIFGGILDRYRALGAETGRLGMPTKSQYRLNSSTWEVAFTGGWIKQPDGGAAVVTYR